MKLSERVVRKAAETGNCVIVGRGAQHFLKDRDDTLRFFLYAPREAKVERLINEGNKPNHAEALIDTVDSDRAAFIKTYFNVDWPNLSAYHAMLNTDVGDDQVIGTMLSYFEPAAKENVG